DRLIGLSRRQRPWTHVTMTPHPAATSNFRSSRKGFICTEPFWAPRTGKSDDSRVDETSCHRRPIKTRPTHAPMPIAIQIGFTAFSSMYMVGGESGAV